MVILRDGIKQNPETSRPSPLLCSLLSYAPPRIFWGLRLFVIYPCYLAGRSQDSEHARARKPAGRPARRLNPSHRPFMGLLALNHLISFRRRRQQWERRRRPGQILDPSKPSPPLVNPPSITVPIVTAHFQQKKILTLVDTKLDSFFSY